jgi:hypothetical protein
MVLFTCNLCNFNSTKKSNYLQHMKTKKHRLNEEKTSQNTKELMGMTQNDPKKTQNDPQMTQNDPQMNQAEQKKSYKCDYCNDSFSTHAHKRRHELHRCKENDDTFFKIIKQKDERIKKQDKELIELKKEMKKEMEKQRKELMNQIELLLTKVGSNNTTITTTNNIQLNNYGNEDLSHITNTEKTQMLKMPYGMIPKMIESVHFDDNKPENRNIMIVNKKDKYIKIVENGKWVYKDKKETLEDLIDGKYYILDEHYNEIPWSELNELQRNRYKEFQTKYDSNDIDLHKKLMEKTEMTLLNQME